MRDILEKYLDFSCVVLGIPHNTHRSIKNDLFQFINFLELENKIFNDVDEMVIRTYVMYLSTETKVSKRTINRKLSSVRTFFKYLLKNGIISENKIQYISFPKYTKTMPTFLTHDEINSIRDVIDTKNILGIRDRAIIETLYSSGVRSQELLDLTESAINFSENQMKVLGKGDKERIVFISEAANKWITLYLQERKKLKTYTNQYIFANKNGGKLTTRSLRRMVELYSKKANILKEVSPHTFRHSFATELLNNQIDIKYVQELLGHSSLSTTQVYTHISKELLKEIYLKVHPLAKKENDE